MSILEGGKRKKRTLGHGAEAMKVSKPISNQILLTDMRFKKRNFHSQELPMVFVHSQIQIPADHAI